MNYSALYMFLLKFGKARDLISIKYETKQFRVAKLKISELVCASINSVADLQKINKEVSEIEAFIKEYVIMRCI